MWERMKAVRGRSRIDDVLCGGGNREDVIPEDLEKYVDEVNVTDKKIVKGETVEI